MSTTDLTPDLTPDQLPHDDRGAAVLVAHWFLTALATVFLALRVYCKRSTNLRLWWDDWILIAAWVIILVTDGLTTALVVDFKLGRHSWDLEMQDLETHGLSKFLVVIGSRATCTITSAGWTKTAFAVTLLRLTTGMTKTFVWFIIVSINITTIVSAIVPWIQCNPLEKSWNPDMPGSCWGPKVGTKIWIGMAAYSALIDFTLAALPWTFLYNALLRKAEKLGILIAMSMGVIAGAVSIAKCAKLPQLDSADLYNAAELYIWDITESTVTVMAACIPTLRVLLRNMRPLPSQNYELSDITFFLDLSKDGSFKDLKVAHQETQLRSSDGRLENEPSRPPHHPGTVPGTGQSPEP